MVKKSNIIFIIFIIYVSCSSTMDKKYIPNTTAESSNYDIKINKK